MCGIFGIINTKKSYFNKSAFNVLGIQNDARGGDSCGIFIDGKIEYGVNDKKLYSKFFPTSALLNNITKCKIALGHCRKASVGAINEKTAQPVALVNKQGDIDFVVLHNGTIYNYEELAEKYIPKININGLTDSQVMALIFYNCGYDVLAEYRGAGVFFIVDYRTEKPSIFVFKGESKYGYYNQTKEERPFYFIQDDNKFIFSSIPTYLEAFIPGEESYTVKPNRLIAIEDGDIRVVKEYDRLSCFQDKPVVCDTTYYNYYYNNEAYSSNNSPKYVIATKDLKYTQGGNPAHGDLYVTKNGILVDKKDKRDKLHVYFWDGTLLYNKQCFDLLLNVCDVYGFKEEELKFVYPHLINHLSPYPTKNIEYLDDNCNPNNYYKGDICYGMIPYTGVFQPLFSCMIYNIKNGELSYNSYSNGYESAYNDFEKSCKQFNELDEIKEILNEEFLEENETTDK